METKTCKICNAEKPTSNFYKKSSYCKQCSIEYSKNYYQEHKEELAPYYRAKTKQYGIDHPDYWSDYKKTHDESEPTKEKRRAMIRKRNQTHPDYPVLNKIYNKLWQIFNRNSFSEKTQELFSCTKEQFFKHLNSKFTEEMNIENYGVVWKMGHKKPPSKFDLQTEEGVNGFAHYKNLLPIPKKYFNKKP